MGQRVLLVEDDPSVREAAAIVLERASFSVHGVADGADALARVAGGESFDVVILDLMLPSLSGFDVCREIRKISGVPIVMLTAKTHIPAELAARIRAVLRRATGETPGQGAGISARDVLVDEGAFRAYRNGQELALTTIEFRLVSELVRNAGLVLTRERLLERVWGYDYLGDSRLVDMAVKRLRGKLGEAADGSDYITTVRGVGYRFERG